MDFLPKKFDFRFQMSREARLVLGPQPSATKVLVAANAFFLNKYK